MAEIFKAEGEKVKEGGQFDPEGEVRVADSLNSRASDKEYVNTAVEGLRLKVGELNKKLEKARSPLGLLGLNENEAQVVANLTADRLNQMGQDFLTKLKAEGEGGDPEVYDSKKADLIRGLTSSLDAYIRSELDTVIKVVDDQDADPAKVAQALGQTQKNRTMGEVVADTDRDAKSNIRKAEKIAQSN